MPRLLFASMCIAAAFGWSASARAAVFAYTPVLSGGKKGLR